LAVERLDRETEVIEVAPLAPRGRPAPSPDRAVHRDQVDQRAAGAKLDEPDLVPPPLDGAAEDVAVEGEHPVEVPDAQHDVVDPQDPDQSSRITSTRAPAS